MFDSNWNSWWIWAIISVVAVIVFILSLVLVRRTGSTNNGTLPGPCGTGIGCSRGQRCINVLNGHQCIPESQSCQNNSQCGPNQRCWDNQCINEGQQPVKTTDDFMNKTIEFRWMGQIHYPVPAGKYHNGEERMAFWANTSEMKFSYGKFVSGDKLYITTNGGHISLNISSTGQLTTNQDRQTDLSIENNNDNGFFITDARGSYLEAVVHNNMPVGMVFRGPEYSNPFERITPETTPIQYYRAIFTTS